MSTKDLKPKIVRASYWHAAIVDKEDNLYMAGQVKNCGS